MGGDLEEQKWVLIELIEWYRDEYHKRDTHHSQMIQEILQAKQSKELEIYERIVEGWLDS